ncbi:hypothetical protein [Aquimarina aquimarini]|uniref:hypothetical protein n=1 Tax=Aquimarina aquimarini TaxID=1191734 RepID=UPI000D54C8BC|nr:hypothetical protein [Aquimarina aquimarini]
MNTKTFLIIIICLSIIQSCKTTKTSVKSDATDIEAVYVYQNGKEKRIIGEDSKISIEANKFSVRFNNKPYNAQNEERYSAQVTAFLNKEELLKIKSGMPKSETNCFTPGTGMAPNQSGRYESLIFGNDRHHYLVYKNSESKRLKLLNKSNHFMTLEFEIDGVYYNGKEEKMATTDLGEFYLAILIDRNLNGIIDKGELKKITIRIK